MAKPGIFNSRSLNGWPLFYGGAFLMSALVLGICLQKDMTDPDQVSEMIQVSVRVAVPWLFLAFAASSMVCLMPNEVTKWMMRNRRILGLCFAAGMAWQLFFIVWYVFGHFDAYMRDAYNIYDLAEEIPGYLFLIAMTVTSFAFGRRWLSAASWRLLHKTGMYVLWGVVWSTYWFELYYYGDIQFIDHVYYWLGISAWFARVLAWSQQRLTRAQGHSA